MAKARIQTRSDQRSANPRELSMLARAVALLVIVFAIVGALDFAGLFTAADHSIHSRWYRMGDTMGSSRKSASRVVLVAGDAETFEEFGAPPWDANMLASMVKSISDAEPLLIAEVGHERLFHDVDQLHKIADDDEDKPEKQRRVDRADLSNVMMQDLSNARSPWTAGGLEQGTLDASDNSRIREIVSRAKLDAIGDRVPVHWMVPEGRLPVLPAHLVLSGEIDPHAAFAQRVVLIGVTADEYVHSIDTPLGWRSSTEVEAHALAGIADGVLGWRPNLAMIYGVCLCLAVAMLWVFERVRGSTASMIITFMIVSVLTLDYICLDRGVAVLGAARPLSVLVLVSASYWIAQAVETLSGLGELRTRVLREATGEPAVDEAELDEGFWDDLAELGASYAMEVVGGEATSTIVERPSERWRLEVRASSERLDEDSHAFIEGRENFDLRRAPFRSAWLTMRASWTTNILPRGPRYGARKSLLVPLENEGEMFGLWMIHLSDEIELEREEIETLEELGRQMAGAILRRRERSALREQAGEARLRDHLETIVGGLRLMHDEHRWALELLEQLPVRAIIATVWGEIEFFDPRVRLKLSREYPNLFSDEDDSEKNLRVVIARLTGKSLDEAHGLMRKVVRDGMELELEVENVNPDDPVVWMLSRIRSKRGIDLPGFKPAVHEHILLMARSSAPAKRHETRSGRILKVLGGAFGRK
ncbi:hypothetical protein PPSIR1_06753 [Plesiocystis pacifica SIR-1]|uniref:CHASE2 domain-containing protein n=2 Tax=Plesiocystis pacifica TaxID=191768 RepID=A6GDK4_9BACT|nr:hypothetical protein PPSIR1_06753 [Plesiocystis pacifica SIR-1]